MAEVVVFQTRGMFYAIINNIAEVLIIENLVRMTPIVDELEFQLTKIIYNRQIGR